MWFMMSAQDATNPATMQIVENVGSSFFADIYIPPGSLAVDWEIQAGAAYASQTLFTATAGVWYFLAICWVDADTVRLFWRAFGSESLTGSGDLTVTAGTWDKAGWLNFTGGTPSANQRAHSARMWHAALSEAEILAESRSPVPVRTSNIDSAMTWLDATDAGDDESGNNRDWTVNGTLATVDLVPVLAPLAAAAATAQAPTALAVQPVTVPLATASAAALAPVAVPTQPVTLPLAAATASPLAPTVLAVQPVTVPLAAVTASPLAPVAETNEQPVTVPLAAVTASPLAPSGVAEQPVTVPLATASAAPLAPTLGTLVQPVTLPLGAVLAIPRPPLVGPDPSGPGRRSGRGVWRADRSDAA